MIARGMQLIDIDPAGWSNFLRIVAPLAPSAPRAVLWHEDGMGLRLTLDGQLQNLGAQVVQDARASAATLHARLAGRARQVVVTGRDGYRRLSDTLNLQPRPDELKYEYQARLGQAVNELNDETFAVYPALTLDRGPLSFARIKDFADSLGAGPANVVLGVFEQGRPYFNLTARLNGSLAEQVSGLEHWQELFEVQFTAESLDHVAQTLESGGEQVACALFIERGDLERLYDGGLHESLPGSLIVGGRAFGISNLPGVAENSFLAAAGLFAYVPLCLPSI
jgi:hypothetical protein